MADPFLRVSPYGPCFVKKGIFWTRDGFDASAIVEMVPASIFEPKSMVPIVDPYLFSGTLTAIVG